MTTVDGERSAIAAWLRWSGVARALAAADARGITDPVERYRHLAVHYHGLRGERLEAYMAWVTAALRDGRWQPLPSPILPEDVVGRGGAAVMRAHGLYPLTPPDAIAAAEPTPIDPGVAGSSSRREYERLAAKREASIKRRA